MSATSELSLAATLGCSEQDILPVQGAIALHCDVIKPWHLLVDAAKKEGFDLRLVSAYRGFEHQSRIWNAKLQGLRPVLDDDGHALVLEHLSPLERVQRVMRWSALPGTSRHHWGTDMDIFDAAAVPSDYQLQLIPEEYNEGGPFAPMIQWLQAYLKDNASPDFFFPYKKDLGGVHPEPWHLSYRPVAEQFQARWSLKALLALLESSELEEKETVIKHIETLYERYIVSSLNSE